METVYALVLLDLSGASDEARDKFFARLRELRWQPVDAARDAWTVNYRLAPVIDFGHYTTVEDAIDKDLSMAGFAAGFAKYRRSLMLGPRPPFEMS